MVDMALIVLVCITTGTIPRRPSCFEGLPGCRTRCRWSESVLGVEVHSSTKCSRSSAGCRDVVDLHELGGGGLLELNRSLFLVAWC